MPRSTSTSRSRAKAATTNASSWRLRDKTGCTRPSPGAMPALSGAKMDNLGSLLTETCKAFADASALDDTDRALTYRQLSEAASAIERALLSGGLTPDEPVLVPVANEARDPAALMGVWRAGGVAVPVARNAPASSIEAMRATTGARFSLTNTAEEPVSQVGEKAPPHRPLLEGAALIVFTSGSTGRPKGVVLSHCAFVGKLEAIDNMLGFTAHTRALLVLQITFVFGMWISLLTLLSYPPCCANSCRSMKRCPERCSLTPVSRGY